MMWDIGGGNVDSSGQAAQMRMPSPGFPVPQQAASTPGAYSANSYSQSPTPAFPASYIGPPPEKHGHSSASRAFHQYPSAQPPVIIVKHNHHSHHHKHHRSHSRPPPVSQSTSYQSTYTQGPQYHHPSSHNVSSYQPTYPQGRNQPAPAPELNAHFQYSKCTGRKKALCIGINYRGQPNELRGCINDARHVRDFLINKQGYRPGDIVLLTDDGSNPRELPTKKNILDAMRWLVRSARTNDSLFFHYSGHGGQTKDQDGDEVDGWDEVIYPLDFKRSGHIVDDEMHDIMVRPLPTGCRLTALFDSCHSGTVLDLPYIYSSHGRLRGGHVSNRARARKSTPADVISWSGCKDGQTSADTFAGGVAVGAMSYAFITSLTKNPNQTYQDLLRSVRLILYPKFSQKPQLGSSHHIDTNLRFII